MSTATAVDASARDRLIGLIYQATTEDGLWPGVLAELADLTGGVEACLVGLTKHSSPPHLIYSGDFNFGSGRLYSPEMHRSYQLRYAKLDLMAIRAASLPVGKLGLSCDLVRENEIRTNEFFQDFLVPSGGGHIAGWNLVNDSKQLVSITFHSSRDDLFGSDFRRAWEIAKHVKEAIKIRSILVQQANNAAKYRSILEIEGVAYLLVNSRGKVIECSKHASEILALGQPFGIGLDGRLFLQSRLETRHLFELIQKASVGIGGGTVRVKDMGNVYFLQVTPLGVHHELALRSKIAECALIVVRSVILQGRRRLNAFRQAFSFTQGEADVALALSSGLTPIEVAKARNVSINTTRTHIRHLLMKTGAKRIPDLISLLNLIR